MNLTQYLKFDRLSTRSEYWAVLLISWLATFFVGGVGAVMIIADGIMILFGGVFMLVSCILLLWITFAITANRCRDAGINPWWAASIMIPYVGFVTMVIFGCLETKTTEEISQ